MRNIGVLAAIVAVLSLSPQAAFATVDNFSFWLKALRAEAVEKGVSPALVREALPESLRPIPRIIELDRKQPEKTITLAKYLENTVTPGRIATGRTKMAEHSALLAHVEKAYGVDASVIVALWGIETSFGKNTGGYGVIESLATLAHDGRRGQYFREELIKALQILDSKHISIKNMRGSWAGAMGQCQFMPSSFLRFAEDWNDDGRRDIWNTEADVFASAANYLAQSGWKAGEPWGRLVRLTKDFDFKLLGVENKQTLQFWHDHGVRLPNGRSVDFEGSFYASIIRPDGPLSPAYIIYDNYRVIMKWNKSTYFATAVGLLADALKKH